MEFRNFRKLKDIFKYNIKVIINKIKSSPNWNSGLQEALDYPIMEMSTKTLTEMRRYKVAPNSLHDVMKATLLLLGNHEGVTEVNDNNK